MKVCPTCQNQYPEDANFCPREECAGPGGPQKLQALVVEPGPRFVPLSRLGGSASGEVWQANDSQTGQAVAYKLVAAAAFPSVVQAERCLRELKQLQRANNPHLVRVVDFGKTPAGTIFVASELASGDPLDERVRSTGPVPFDRAKKIVAQIGEALLEGQKVGVVHRDLSPKNVLVSADDVVRVINFPVPRPFSENASGVPEFMSPEQAEGKLIDQRSNTYSLGAILYFLLTGEPPVSGATPAAVVAAITKGEIVPPSVRRPGSVPIGAAPEVAQEVDRLVLKALERNSSRRPLTMRQFLSDVAALTVNAGPRAAAEPPATASTASTDQDAGFARTMMFAGGSPEVQKLVNQAVAARTAHAENSLAPTVVPVAAPATPPPASNGSSPKEPEVAPTGTTPRRDGLVAATPAPLAQSPRPLQATASGETRGAHSLPAGAPAPGNREVVDGAPGAATNFRETLWFKKGDVDQMVADARARMEKAATPPPVADPEKAAAVGDSGPTSVAVESKPLEDRYLDDGTVTVDDRNKFSLRSGGTSAVIPARGGPVPGERMSENEVLEEIGGGKRFVIVGVVGAAVLAIVAVIWLSAGGRGAGKVAVPTAGEQAKVAPPAASPKAEEPAPLAPVGAVAPPTPGASTVASPPPAPVQAAPSAVPASAEAAAENGGTDSGTRGTVRKRSTAPGANKKKSPAPKHSATGPKRR